MDSVIPVLCIYEQVGLPINNKQTLYIDTALLVTLKHAILLAAGSSVMNLGALKLVSIVTNTLNHWVSCLFIATNGYSI